MEESKKFKLPQILQDGEGSVKFTDLENFFNVYQDEDAYYHFNLNSTVYLSVPPSRMKSYVCQHDLHWTTISYNLYGTVRLAWVLMKLNNITPDISFNIVPAGSTVKYLDRGDITTIIDQFGKD